METVRKNLMPDHYGKNFSTQNWHVLDEDERASDSGNEDTHSIRKENHGTYAYFNTYGGRHMMYIPRGKNHNKHTGYITPEGKYSKEISNHQSGSSARRAAQKHHESVMAIGHRPLWD
jgi:hypothetical protein